MAASQVMFPPHPPRVSVRLVIAGMSCADVGLGVILRSTQAATLTSNGPSIHVRYQGTAAPCVKEPAPFQSAVIMAMSMPKNTSKLDYVLAGCSALGACLAAYSAYQGPGMGRFPAQYFVNFTAVAFGLYGLGFFAAPKLLITMNFSAAVDAYHEFLARFMGFTMMVFVYIIYSVLGTADAFKLSGIMAAGCGLLGPTFAALYLSPKRAPPRRNSCMRTHCSPLGHGCVCSRSRAQPSPRAAPTCRDANGPHASAFHLPHRRHHRRARPLRAEQTPKLKGASCVEAMAFSPSDKDCAECHRVFLS